MKKIKLLLAAVILIQILFVPLTSHAEELDFNLDGKRDDFFTRDKMFITQDVLSSDGRLLENPDGDFAKFYYDFDENNLYFYLEAKNYHGSKSFDGFSVLEFMVNISPMSKYQPGNYPLPVNAENSGIFAFTFSANPKSTTITADHGTSPEKLAAIEENYYLSYIEDAKNPNINKYIVELKIPRIFEGIQVDPSRFSVNAVFRDENRMRHLPLNSNYPTYVGLLDVFYENQPVPAGGIVLDDCSASGAPASENAGVVEKNGKLALKTAYVENTNAPARGESRVLNRFADPNDLTALNRFCSQLPLDRAIISFDLFIEEADLPKFKVKGSYINFRINSGLAPYMNHVNSYEIQSLTELKSGWNRIEIPAAQAKANGYGHSAMAYFSAIESWGLFFRTPADDTPKHLYISDIRLQEADFSKNPGFRQWVSDMDVYIGPDDYWAPSHFDTNALNDKENPNESFFGPTIVYNKTFKGDGEAVLSNVRLDASEKVQGKYSLAFDIANGGTKFEFIWQPQSARQPSQYRLRPGNMVMVYSVWIDDVENTAIAVSVTDRYGTTDYNQKKLDVTLTKGWNTVTVPIDRSLLNDGAGTMYVECIRIGFTTRSRVAAPVKVKYDNIYFADKYEIEALNRQKELENAMKKLPEDLAGAKAEELKEIADFCKTFSIEATAFLPRETAERWESILAANEIVNPEYPISAQEREAAESFVALMELSAEEIRNGDDIIISAFKQLYFDLSERAQEYVEWRTTAKYKDVLAIIKGTGGFGNNGYTSGQEENGDDESSPKTGEKIMQIFMISILIVTLAIFVVVFSPQNKIWRFLKKNSK